MRRSVLGLVLGLAACATTYGPARREGAPGYSERALAPGEWLLVVRGNYATDAARVYQFWHRRATELAAAESCGGYTVEELLVMPADPVSGAGASASGRLRCKHAQPAR